MNNLQICYVWRNWYLKVGLGCERVWVTKLDGGLGRARWCVLRVDLTATEWVKEGSSRPGNAREVPEGGG